LLAPQVNENHKTNSHYNANRGECQKTNITPTTKAVSKKPKYLPGRLRAGSIESGLLDVAITKTAFVFFPSDASKG
jgi:hypothetical protein